MKTKAPFRLSAVGDISFEGSESDRASIDCFGDAAQVFHDSDLVVGNLECALVQKGNAIPGKCTLRGSPEWASAIRSAGIGVVTLANNHAMDYGKQG
ncbi:MAG: poly-gamma-glutamate biosynthesis protein, partial [Gemmatimonadetes bacterium]